MKKWNGKIVLVEVLRQETNRPVQVFLADDVLFRSPKYVFYLNLVEVGNCNSETCYYRISDSGVVLNKDKE